MNPPDYERMADLDLTPDERWPHDRVHLSESAYRRLAAQFREVFERGGLIDSDVIR